MSWDKRYRTEVLSPVLASIRDAVDARIVKFTPELRKQITRISQDYGVKLESLLSDLLSQTEVTARQSFFRELERQVPAEFRVERGSVHYKVFSGNVYRQVGERWTALLDVNKPAAVNWLRKVAEDGLTLSDRVWRDVVTFKRTMENTIARNIQMGRSAQSLGKQLLTFAKQQPVELSQEMKAFIETLAPDDARKAIEKYVNQKMRYNANRVARTEIQRAYRTSYIDQAKKLDFVNGVKWNRSRTEFDCSVCHNLATQDLYELGPGVYPPDKAPIVPHPHCRCYYTTELMPLTYVK